MSDNKRFIRLLLDFDRAISWPDIERVTSKALSFFDEHFNLERISITHLDQANQCFVVFTRDTSVPHLSTGDRH